MNAPLSCRTCGLHFTVEEKETQIRGGISFGVLEKTFFIPDPQLCPQCRYQRRLANRNEWSLYHRKCDGTGQQIISIYAPENPVLVFGQEYWWGGTWDPLAYGFPYNSEQSFFSQFDRLRKAVPRLCITNPHCENSRYTNQGSHNTDCYRLVASNFNDRCFFGSWIQKCSSVLDSYLISESSKCYECSYCSHIQRGRFLTDCHNCSDAWLSNDCTDCTSIFGCQGLRGTSYCIFNRQVGATEWAAFIEVLNLSTQEIDNARIQLSQLQREAPQKPYRGRDNTESSGDYMEECFRSSQVINARRCRNLAFGQDAWEALDSVDHTETLDTSMCSEIEGSMACRNSLGITRSWELTNTFYSELCFESQHLFGCVGLRKKEFCILNVQFSEQEYYRQIQSVIAHMQQTQEWGEFFPIESSPFAYNESVAQDYFPLTGEEVIQRGWRWRDSTESEDAYLGPKTVVPALISESTDDVLKGIYRCEDTGRPFRIIKEELALCRELGVPLSRKCPDRRRVLRLERAGRIQSS